MKVVGMDVIFSLALVWPLSDIHNVSYDPNTTHGSTQSCISPNLKKIYLFTLLCLELDLGVFMTVVDIDVNFHFPLIW